MKRLLLLHTIFIMLFLSSLFTISCNTKEDKIEKHTKYTADHLKILVLDSCQYIVYIIDGKVIHKENCNNKIHTKNINPRSYQIDVHDTFIDIYDGNRYVGKIDYVGTELDILITKDNQ